MANRGCGCKVPTDVRMTSDGGFEASFDNGMTWQPYYDVPNPGSTIPVIPLPPGMTVNNGSCSGAESTAQVFKSFTDFICGNEVVWETVATLITAFVAALAAYFGVGSWVAALLGAIVLLIWVFTRDAFCALFTEDIWEELRCILYCNINSDASYSADQLASIIEAIYATEWHDLVKRWLTFNMGLIGTGGMTNTARTFVNLIADCSDCGCDCDDISAAQPENNLTARPDIGTGWWEVTTVDSFPPIPSGNGDHYAVINVPACCCLTAYNYTEGLNNAPPGNRVAFGCDEVFHTGNYGLNAGLVNQILFRAFEAGIILFRIEEVCT